MVALRGKTPQQHSHSIATTCLEKPPETLVVLCIGVSFPLVPKLKLGLVHAGKQPKMYFHGKADLGISLLLFSQTQRKLQCSCLSEAEQRAAGTPQSQACPGTEAFLLRSGQVRVFYTRILWSYRRNGP